MTWLLSIISLMRQTASISAIASEAALQRCYRLRLGLTIQALSRIWSVPLKATAPRYRDYHERLIEGLRKAGMPEH